MSADVSSAAFCCSRALSLALSWSACRAADLFSAASLSSAALASETLASALDLSSSTTFTLSSSAAAASSCLRLASSTACPSRRDDIWPSCSRLSEVRAASRSTALASLSASSLFSNEDCRSLLRSSMPFPASAASSVAGSWASRSPCSSSKWASLRDAIWSSCSSFNAAMVISRASDCCSSAASAFSMDSFMPSKASAFWAASSAAASSSAERARPSSADLSSSSRSDATSSEWAATISSSWAACPRDREARASSASFAFAAMATSSAALASPSSSRRREDRADSVFWWRSSVRDARADSSRAAASPFSAASCLSRAPARSASNALLRSASCRLRASLVFSPLTSSLSFLPWLSSSMIPSSSLSLCSFSLLTCSIPLSRPSSESRASWSAATASSFSALSASALAPRATSAWSLALSAASSSLLA